MKNKMSKMKGFTLVELLIVIALIAILSVAVLATINPIEQSNKARDAAMKNDAAEVLGAYERYYAAQNAYPWNAPNSTDVNVLLSSTSPSFGVVSVGTSIGALIESSELKTSFAGKKPFAVGSAMPEDMLYVYHNASGNSNYVCYFPKATANRTGNKASDLKCVDLAGGEIIDQSTTCVVPTDWTYVPSSTTANVACVPEGSIQ